MASIDESKEKLKELYATREEMEKEMAEIAQRLTEPGMPGLRGALVDREGFPIPGVDLYQVRGDRGRYATLRNDHSEVTKELGARWKAIGPEEKSVFEAKAKEDKERYAVEMEAYEATQRAAA